MNDKFKGCNKINMPQSNTCPTCNGSNNAFENCNTSNSNSNKVFFTSELFSDIDSDMSDTQDTLNTSDMQFSSSGSILNTSFNSDLIEDSILDDDFLSSLSENEFDNENKNINEITPELDTVSVSSGVTSSIGDTNKIINHNCAVLLCNENARKQFDTLFFINFPNDLELSNTWWAICGRKDKFDPSSKICSIHFDTNDFKTINIRRDGRLYRQTILKNSDTVPTRYLLPHEYTKFTRKRKNNINDNLNSGTSKKSSESKKCIIRSCNKTFLKDSRSTLFFKFPLDNKVMVKKWLDKIELPNWQPLETDRICSNHFENYYVMKYNNVYKLDKYAVPSIKPQNPFDIKSEKFNKKYEHSEHTFRNLEFKKLDDYVLLVSEKNKKNYEKEQNNLLGSLENYTVKNNQIKSLKKIPETITSHSNSAERINILSSSVKCNNSSVEYMDVLDDLNNIEELQLKLDNSTSLTKQYLESFEREIAEEIEKNGSSNNNNNLEYIYLDLFNNENMIKGQPITTTNDGSSNNCNETELELKTKENNLENVSTSISNDTTSGITYNNFSSDLIQDSQIKSNNIDNIFEVTSTMPKQNSVNANDRSCTNLNMLNSNDGTFLSKNECILEISNNKKSTGTAEHMMKTEVKTKDTYVKNCTNVTIHNNISPTKLSSNSTKMWHIESIDNINSEVNPESIIYNQDLSECYGEMLPPYCNSDCQLLCFYSVPGPQRREIYNEFLMLPNVTEQNCKIAELVELRFIKKGDTLKSCVSYNLAMNKKLVKVCQKFFINTLGISEHRLDAILKPINYSWYSNRDNALKVNIPKQVKLVTDELVIRTDFINESLILLNKDYNLFEPENDTEVSLENVPFDEYEKAVLFVKSIPRVLSTCQITVEMKKRYFETSVCVENMYKMYSENYIKNKTPPPFTELQFKKMYNQCMKTLLKLV